LTNGEGRDKCRARKYEKDTDSRKKDQKKGKKGVSIPQKNSASLLGNKGRGGTTDKITNIVSQKKRVKETGLGVQTRGGKKKKDKLGRASKLIFFQDHSGEGNYRRWRETSPGRKAGLVRKRNCLALPNKKQKARRQVKKKKSCSC